MIGNITTAYDRALTEMKQKGYVPKTRERDGEIDRSVQDICVARFLLTQCVPRPIVVEALLHGSEKAQERGMEYVERTVRAVCF